MGFTQGKVFKALPDMDRKVEILSQIYLNQTWTNVLHAKKSKDRLIKQLTLKGVYRVYGV